MTKPILAEFSKFFFVLVFGDRGNEQWDGHDETDSQNVKRLAKTREYKRRKILEETPKERENRLAKMRTYWLKKKITETESVKQAMLNA